MSASMEDAIKAVHTYITEGDNRHDAMRLVLNRYEDRILSLITEHTQRYSTGSQGRVALDNLALEIRERG